MSGPDATLDVRVLVLAPVGRDAALADQALGRAGLVAVVCADLDALCGEVRRGAGALLVAEEAVAGTGLARLTDALADEPAWSDLPVLILLAPGGRRDPRRPVPSRFDPLRNVTLLDRPVRVAALVSTLQAALRARRRQYEVRDLMAELHRLLRVKDEFLAAVSHELRTPLNVVLGFTSVLMRADGDPPQITRAAQAIDRNARILWQLVEDLIDVARGASGRFRLELAPVDLGVIVATAADTLRTAANTKEIELTCDLDPGVPPVSGDATRLQQVVWNLLWNALKFTPRGGRIELTTSCRGGVAEIVVRDTGIGIERDLLPRIFDPFRQGRAPASDPQRGLGLGLSIVRHLVELHGGSVEAQSLGAGHGARFIVRLPVLDPAPGERERDTPPDHRMQPSAGGSSP
jgi:signal transduction histidine kinase